MADGETQSEVRRQFEAWVSAAPFERSIERFADNPVRHAWPGAYRDITVDLAWQAWLESAARNVSGDPRAVQPV